MRQLMSQAHFNLIYDGPDLVAGEMDVADLAPALLAMGEFVKASARAVYGSDVQVSVKVKATNTGSFEVVFAMAVEAAGSAWEFWKKDDTRAAADLLGLLGFTGTVGVAGVIWAVKKLAGRPARLRPAATPGSIELETPDGVILIPEGVGRIVVDRAARAALERLVAEPLARDGIDRVVFSDGRGSQEIREAEADAFRAPIQIEDDEFVSRYTRAFSIVSIHFGEGRKWRLSDGRGPPKQIAIEDPLFNRQVAANQIRFAKGDVLICDVVETSRRTATGFKSEFEIVKVVEHRPAPPAAPELPLSPTPG
ncbi:hypothetical protein [Brevundimonas sp.]|uniref:hypothetical protein n=1 Tax=Brevundimonas sp. TaxID=1871086 RepID=UPI0022BF99FB|nr:hypothetical protein [Brevundimonas sp.]MCZ8194993.1 hypothetical protein [Brevundimonas sp.]